MTTSFIEMLELPNISHMTTFTINFETSEKFFDEDIDIYSDVITLISKDSYFKKAWSYKEATFKKFIIEKI